MLRATIRRLEHDKRGVSNVIVVMLSLVLVVVIVANVVLWSYQMNQFDWERIQESVKISNATRVNRSSWFVTEEEYNINVGSVVNGTYKNTQTADGLHETFREENFQLETLHPDAAGQYTEWPRESPAGNVHWSLVDEVPPDDDATYIENNAEAWRKDSYDLKDPAGSGTINWICIYVRARATSSGNSIVRALMRSYNTDYESSDIAMSTSYQDNYMQYFTNPYTGLSWTWTELASLQAGASSRKSGAANVRLTTVWVVVNYTSTNYSFDMIGTYALDLSAYPLDYIKEVEMQLKYRANDTAENWYLKAYNWTAAAYSDYGFNNTWGHAPTADWDIYAVNLTDKWRSYVSDDGVLWVKLQDNQSDADQTTIDIDFLGIILGVDGAKLFLQNQGSLTSHIIAVWIINATIHKRHNADFFINSGENADYIRADICFPANSFIVKVVTERGNIAIFKSD